MEVVATLGTGQTEADTQYLLKALPMDVRLIYRIIATCIYLVYHTDLIAPESAYFLHALIQSTLIDFDAHAIRTMWNVHRIMTNTALPFGGLIMKIVGIWASHPEASRALQQALHWHQLGLVTKAATQQQREDDPAVAAA
jgi:hypothetical protein